MKVKFRTTLGSRDAAQLHIDPAPCVVGAEVDVSQAAAEVLAARGIVEPLTQPKAIKAVPTKPTIAKAKETDEK